MSANFSETAFSHQRLRRILAQLPATPSYWVAYSGGCDSTALLHAMTRLRDATPDVRFRALHVDHGLQADSSQWASHCLATCSQLGVECVVEAVQVDRGAGGGPEARARRARYSAFRRYLGEGEMILLGQHRDDQAETVLLQLLRGGGAKGLAAMPAIARFGLGYLARPLLDISRDELKVYVQDHDLTWIDDPSNSDTRLRRNFLRQNIIPQLSQHWPQVAKNLARSAGVFASTARLLDSLASKDLRRVAAVDENALEIDRLLRLSNDRRKNLLRTWLRRNGFTPPRDAQLERLDVEMLRCATDAEPAWRWCGGEMRRYRNRLYALAHLPLVPQGENLPWTFGESLDLPSGLGRIECETTRGRGLSMALQSRRDLQVRWRQGGEALRLPGRSCTHKLKNLFQETAVPPWARDRVPLIYAGAQLAAVGDLWVAAEFAAGAGENGLLLNWRQQIYQKSAAKGIKR